MILNLIGVLALALFTPIQDSPASQERVLERSFSNDALAPCLQGLVHVTGVAMECTINADGRAERCTILNPSPALRRHERKFQCMASRMTFHYSDGSSTDGAVARFNIGGQTLTTRRDYQRAEREAQND